MADVLTPPRPAPARAPRPGRAPGLLLRYALRLFVATYLVLLVAWPVSLVAINAFDGGVSAVVDTLADPDVRAALRLTVFAAACAVVINTVFGVGMSMLLVRHRFPGRSSFPGPKAATAAGPLGPGADRWR